MDQRPGRAAQCLSVASEARGAEPQSSLSSSCHEWPWHPCISFLALSRHEVMMQWCWLSCGGIRRKAYVTPKQWALLRLENLFQIGSEVWFTLRKRGKCLLRDKLKKKALMELPSVWVCLQEWLPTFLLLCSREKWTPPTPHPTPPHRTPPPSLMLHRLMTDQGGAGGCG